MKLQMKVLYNLEPDTYEIQSDIKQERWKDMLEAFIRAKMQGGEDNREVNEEAIYEIRLGIDLTDDSITVGSNCGNKGLETGILMQLFNRMNDGGIVN